MDTVSYGPEIDAVLDFGRLCPLGPGQPDRDVVDQLTALKPTVAFAGLEIVDLDMANCCLSGIWLRHDFLDESHVLSQDIGSSSGSYWHAIMHRREPDYANSKYWFRKVGTHPVFKELCAEARKLCEGGSDVAGVGQLANQTEWDPYRFVDLCQLAAPLGGPAEQIAREVARLEWQLLFDYCYHQAIDK